MARPVFSAEDRPPPLPSVPTTGGWSLPLNQTAVRQEERPEDYLESAARQIPSAEAGHAPLPTVRSWSLPLNQIFGKKRDKVQPANRASATQRAHTRRVIRTVESTRPNDVERQMSASLIGDTVMNRVGLHHQKDLDRSWGSQVKEHRKRRKAMASDEDRDQFRAVARRREKDFVVDDDDDDPQETVKVRRGQRKKQRRLAEAARKAASPPSPILIPEFISVANLAHRLKVAMASFARRLNGLGFVNTNHDHILNAETAGLIAMEFNREPIPEKNGADDLHAMPEVEHGEAVSSRPPVVTIMGHVDHGKTTLLDYLRKSSIVVSEYGGITQHIGAFSVSMPSGKVITFLDTPGHEAFLNMRQRGAQVTDIVILVVAADDSVKPQTVEAIKHAKSAKVPMIVAINKIDKDNANVERVKQDLARHGVEVEDIGGDTQVVCVSGKTGQGIGELEEAVITLSEILDVRADPEGQAEGTIIETTTKKAGRVATVLVRRGTFRPGQVVVAGSTWARIRTLRNEAGIEMDSAGPGMPAEVDGWKEQPTPGDEVLEAPDEAKAKDVVAYRAGRTETLKMAADVEAVNEVRRVEHEKRERARELGDEGNYAREAREDKEMKMGNGVEVSFIIKADVSGSVEAVRDSIEVLGNEQVRSKILRAGVGPVTEFDVEHAAAAKGHVLAFNVSTEPGISRLADISGVSIVQHNVIYHLTDGVKTMLAERLPLLITQHVTGEADISQIFDINIKGRQTKTIAGCKIRNGVINRSSKVRVLRNKEVVYDGGFSSIIFARLSRLYQLYILTRELQTTQAH